MSEFDPNSKEVQAAIKAALDEARSAWEADTEGLKAKNKELLNKLRSATEIKPEDLAAAEDRADKAERALADATKQVKALTSERDKAVQAREQESAFTQKLLIQDGIKSALIANGVKDEDYIDSLAAKFSQGATIVANGDAREAMLGDKKLADAIKEWAGTDAGKKFVAAPLNGGGGAPGGGGAGGGKTVTRAQWDSMNHVERAKFSTEGGKVVDQAA